MLWTIFVILLVLWLLGVVTSYTLGGFIHVLLIVAVILAVMQLIQGRVALAIRPLSHSYILTCSLSATTTPPSTRPRSRSS